MAPRREWAPMLCVCAVVVAAAAGGKGQNYSVEDGAIVRLQGPHFNNRPLYGNHDGTLVLCGDRPLLKFGRTPFINGQLSVGLQWRPGGSVTWFHDLPPEPSSSGLRYKSIYYAGRQLWNITFPSAGLSVQWEAVPLFNSVGFAARVTSAGHGPPGSSLLIAFGGAYRIDGGRPLGWNFDGAVNPAKLSEGWSQSTAVGNRVSLSSNGSFSVAPQTLEFQTVGQFSGATDLSIINASKIFPGATRPSQSAPTMAVPPLSRLAGWFKAETLKISSSKGKVPRWLNSAPHPSAADAVQNSDQHQPLLTKNALNGYDALMFDGISTYMTGAANLTGPKTILAVVVPGRYADKCCSGVVTAWSPDNTSSGSSTNGIALKRDAGSVATVLDFAGENNGGSAQIAGVAHILTARFGSGANFKSDLFVNGCPDITDASAIGYPATQYSLGWRASDPKHGSGRYFNGLLQEVLLYNGILEGMDLTDTLNYLGAKFDIANATDCKVLSSAPLVVAKVPLNDTVDVHIAAAAAPTSSSSTLLPTEAFKSGVNRTDALSTKLVAETPDQYLNAGVSAAAASIDGLFRQQPPVFLHGAMAWDVPLVGWRSQYGGTLWGWEEEVADEGRYMFHNQVTETGKNTACKADPAHLLSVQAADSRFYGKGRVKGGDGMYDMQSQMFDQQIHLWRFTGNSTHGALLRKALELHAQWALDCFDADGDGLYHAYINTWPTDSVQFNGAAAPEESGYMYRTALALMDLARLANDTVAEKFHSATANRIRTAFHSELWISDRGHPAAFKEEIGFRRQRPDAWLYSIFVPIEAGLLDFEKAAQALYYTEWALQRDQFRCANGSSCGVRVWTSNWVPSIWSVREFWPGDNYALANAYFKVGLADDGWAILQGNMMHDMYNFVSPGVLGASNGGIDFNDIVHPFARAVVEGLFGYEPDFPNAIVTIAPKFPRHWQNATTINRHFSLAYRDDMQAGKMTLSFRLIATRPPARLRLQLRLRAAWVSKVLLNGAAVGEDHAIVSVSTGFGVSVVSITTKESAVAANVTILYGMPDREYIPVSINSTAMSGTQITLLPPTGWSFINVSDPQAVFVRKTLTWSAGAINGLVAPTGKTENMHCIVFGYVKPLNGVPDFGTVLTRVVLYKVTVTDPVANNWYNARFVTSAAAPANWTFLDVSSLLNANISNIYHPKSPGYISPRPPTCSARIGTDGYSAWTFTFGQGNAPPFPDLTAVSSQLDQNGHLKTTVGAIFDATHLRYASEQNIAFTSQWDNFPSHISLDVPARPGDVVWLLIAGSTNPMQTLFPNARVRFNFSDGTIEDLELIPPINFWSLSRYGGKYYDYSRDWHCLPHAPPPQARLGNDANAMVYGWKMVNASKTLNTVTLETLSLEVVIGLLAVSVMHTEAPT